MPLFDLPLDRLRSHRSAVTAPDDLAAFWADTLARARANDLDLRLGPEDAGLTVFDVDDVTFNGFAGAPIKAWYLRPRGATGPLPCVVEFVGYGGGRGLPAEWLVWPAAGYAHLVMDTRGQGSEWRSGDTADPWPGISPHAGDFLTLGIEHGDDYCYYRRVTDGARAVDAARALPGVDPTRIVVPGASQGGGIALAVAGLVPSLAAASWTSHSCVTSGATELVETDPYAEIATYLRAHRNRVELTFATLAYFDGAVLCRTATAPALFSVGIMDDTCPPSTVFATINAYGGLTQVREYAYNNTVVEPAAEPTGGHPSIHRGGCRGQRPTRKCSWTDGWRRAASSRGRRTWPRISGSAGTRCGRRFVRCR
jgi:cephalosporin-C deacetylase